MRTALIAAVGDDDYGAAQLRDLSLCGVDVSGVRRSRDLGTGTAVVLVSAEGENSIVVAAGANAALSSADVDDNARLLASAAVVVGQTEVSASAVDAAAAWARRTGSRFILNCAPVIALAPSTFRCADPLVVNEVEAEQLLGRAVGAEHTASVLRERVGARSVVVTRGASGASVNTAEDAFTVPAPTVRVVDTTGAGDAFVGAVAAALAGNASMRDAAPFAVAAGAHAVTFPGARLPGEQEP
jgi:ribokinase